MRKEWGVLLLVLLLCGIVGILNPDFFQGVNLRNNARLVGMYGLLSIGAAIVIITGGIDLSIGSMVALLGVLLAMMIHPIRATSPHWPWPLAVVCVLGLAALLGAIHGLLITKVRMQPFIVTLCGLLLYRGIARYIARDATQGFGNQEGMEWLASAASGNVVGVPMPFVWMGVAAIVMGVVLHRSVYGRYLFAVGRNEEAARYAGIASDRVVISAYVLAALLTGVAAILFAFYTNSIQASTHGGYYELYAIAGAVLGGCSLRGGEGSIPGVILGSVLLVVLRNIVNLLGIESSLDFAVMGGVILVGVLADQLLRSRKRS